MNRHKNFIIQGKHHKPIVADLFYHESATKLPIVIFTHGFKGFKDWGPYDIIAEKFAKAGFAFIKFNFSHNGTTPENLTEFVDLEAFGNNNFTKELDDLQVVVDWLHHHPLSQLFDLTSINLSGHSRGGAISIIKASEDSRISKVASWAAPVEFSRYISQEQLQVWQQTGVIYVENFRTGQQMPLYYQLAEDILSNPQRINIRQAVKALKIPQLIVHGTADETVHFNDALLMHSWNTQAVFKSITQANHSFGAEHPFFHQQLPAHYQQVVEETILFFKANH
jgi:alpha/beta superfamily hydrolase